MRTAEQCRTYIPYNTTPPPYILFCLTNCLITALVCVLVLMRKDEIQVRERLKREAGELKLMLIQVNKIIKEHKIALPITKEGFKRVCKALDLHCSEMLALEGLLYCRGK